MASTLSTWPLYVSCVEIGDFIERHATGLKCEGVLWTFHKIGFRVKLCKSTIIRTINRQISINIYQVCRVIDQLSLDLGKNDIVVLSIRVNERSLSHKQYWTSKQRTGAGTLGRCLESPSKQESCHYYLESSIYWGPPAGSAASCAPTCCPQCQPTCRSSFPATFRDVGAFSSWPPTLCLSHSSPAVLASIASSLVAPICVPQL